MARMKRKDLKRHENSDRMALVLEFCKIPRSRDDITNFLGKSRYYTMDKIVKPLLGTGKLGQTMPDKPKSRNQRFFTIG